MPLVWFRSRCTLLQYAQHSRSFFTVNRCVVTDLSLKNETVENSLKKYRLWFI